MVDDGVAPPVRPGRSTRIGLSAGAEHPWRWFVKGDPECLSICLSWVAARSERAPISRATTNGNCAKVEMLTFATRTS